jgi:hypothetical protein
MGLISGAYLLLMSSLGGNKDAIGNRTSSFSSLDDEYFDNFYIIFWNSSNYIFYAKSRLIKN